MKGANRKQRRARHSSSVTNRQERVQPPVSMLGRVRMTVEPHSNEVVLYDEESKILVMFMGAHCTAAFEAPNALHTVSLVHLRFECSRSEAQQFATLARLQLDEMPA